MKLHEYQSKQIFAAHGVPIPQGEVATTPVEARRIAEALGAVAIKAQVLVGGRGKAGGVRLAATPEEAARAAESLLRMEIKGFPVRQVLVEEAVNIQQEIYLGVVVDRTIRRLVLVASSEGGVEIEEVARSSPGAIKRVVLDPFLGLRSYQTLSLANGIGLPALCRRGFDSIARGLYESVLACDGSLAEINPLVITGDGELLALDGKMVIDDNALFRHPDLAQVYAQVYAQVCVQVCVQAGDVSGEVETARQAREAGLSYVGLDGEIGCLVNGAGLAMATMDVVKHFGGTPANFLDIGGGAKAERVAAALRLILADCRVKVVLLNIFGGITRCDEVAHGIVAALDEALNEGKPGVPLIARLAGTNEAEGRAILAASPHRITVATTLVEAAQKAVATRGRRRRFVNS